MKGKKSMHSYKKIFNVIFLGFSIHVLYNLIHLIFFFIFSCPILLSCHILCITLKTSQAYSKICIHYSYILLLLSSQDFRHEVKLLVKLRHPNIVQFLGAVMENKPLMLITEFLRGVWIISLCYFHGIGFCNIL